MRSRQLPEVYFSEGMLLLPHHFQALHREFESRLDHQRLTWGPARWGVRALDLSLSGRSVAVRRCDVVLPSGTLVVIPENAVAPPARTLEEEIEDAVSVWLGIAKPRAGTFTVTEDGDSDARYFIEESEEQDENPPGSSRTLGYRFLKPRLFLGDEAPEDWDTVKLAEVTTGGGELTPQLELAEDYVPPLLDVTGDGVLQGILRRLVLDNLEQTNETLVAMAAGRPISYEIEGGIPPEIVFKLHATNTLLQPIKQLCTTPGVHPFDAYRGLCQLAGSLALFSEERRCPPLRPYDHEHLFEMFSEVAHLIVELLGIVRGDVWDHYDFEPVEGGILASHLERGWLDLAHEMVVRVLATDGAPEEVASTVRHKLKIVGDQDLPDLTGGVIPGLSMRLVEEPIGLRRGPRIYYFRIDLRDSDEERWDAAKASNRLCVFSEGAMPNYGFRLYVRKVV